MMESRKNGGLVGLPDRFVAAEIETEATPAFDAAQYSFFGDLSAADSGLEGALEDGLEAPPPEEGLTIQDYGLHGPDEEPLPLEEEEDLSVAALFRNQLGLGPPKVPQKPEDPDDDAALDALLHDPLSVARTQLQDEDYDHRGLPTELYPESLSSSRTAASGQPQSLFGAPALSYGLYSAAGASQPQYDAPSGGATDATAGASTATMPSPQPPAPPPNVTGNALLQMLKKPSQLPKAMTLEELEARMLRSTDAAAVPGGGTAGSQQAPTAAGGPPPGMPSPQLPPADMPPGASLQGLRPERPPPPDSGHTAQPSSGPGPELAPGPYSSMPSHQPPPPPPGPHGPLPHGALLPGPGMPPPHPYHMQPHMHPHPMYGMPPPMAGPQGPPGPGPYPGPPLGGHLAHGYPPHGHPMYTNGGMPPPMPPHHQFPHMQHPPGMMPPGAMGPPPYGPGPMPPRPQHHGPGLMGPMGGHPMFPHDPGYPMRPGMNAPGSGMPLGPLHGGALPRPLGQPYGPSAGPSAAAPPPPPPVGAPPRGQGMPAAASHQPPPPPQQHLAGSSGPARPAFGALGAGAAAAPRPAQARQLNGPAAPDFGQQFARGGFAPLPGVGGQQTAVALAAAAAAAGRAGGAVSGPGGRLRGRYMTPENIEYVVRSLLHNVANGVPYVEDYYYQAFVHKHVSAPSRQQLSPGAFPMAALFVPQALRTLSADQMRVMRLDPSAQVKFVEGLQGLGKIVLSNIRTPKVLMDLSDRVTQEGGAKLLPGSDSSTAAVATAGNKGVDDTSRSTRPLEQEPLLAARIMIEDCMNLLLDLDDIDRLATHIAAVAQAQQRAAAVAAALPLPGPAAAVAAAAAGAAAAASTASASAIGPYGPDSEAPPSPAELLQRRQLLLAGINGAFRLPNAPAGVTALAPEVSDGDADGDEEDRSPGGPIGDGVLLRILALSKGRNMVARALLAIALPAGFEALAPKPAAAAAPTTQQQQTAGRTQDTAAAAAAGISATAERKVGDSADLASGSDASPAATSHAAADASCGGAEGQGSSGHTATTAVVQPSTVSLVPDRDSDDDALSPYVLLWGTLRNAWMLFGSSMQQGLDAAAERPMLEATARLAAALRDALLRLPTPRDVVDAAVAFNVGCRQHVDALCQSNPAAAASMELTLLPLAQTRAVETPAVGSVQAAPPAWLGEALAALVMRAGQLGLAVSAPEDKPADVIVTSAEPSSGTEITSGKQLHEGAASVDVAWSREFGLLHDRLSRHLTALGAIHSMAVASANAEALAVVRAMCCRQLVNAMLPHASAEQAQQLREALAAFAA